MTQQTLYQECPLCNRGTVVWHELETVYRCEYCDLTLEERTFLGLFKKGHYRVRDFGKGEYRMAEQSLSNVALRPDLLKVVLGNVYTDQQLADIVGGSVDVIRPVRTVLAQIILEQLNEVCYLQVNGLRRGHGLPLAEGGHYLPTESLPRQGMDWQDEGNLFCTDQRLVFPSNKFTFIRMGRKLVGVQAFTNGVAIQLKGEAFATYFGNCYPHEAALVAAYVMAKVPKLQASQKI